MTQTLVTGGGGFIGQHLVAALLAQGRRVRILDLRPPTCPMTGAQFVSGSVLDPELVREALNDVGEVYHLAALPGMWIPRKDDFHAVNCRGTEIMLDAARKRGVSRFLQEAQLRDLARARRSAPAPQSFGCGSGQQADADRQDCAGTSAVSAAEIPACG